MLHTHFTALCFIDAELLAIEILMCAEADTHKHPLREYLLWTFLSHETLTFTR